MTEKSPNSVPTFNSNGNTRLFELIEKIILAVLAFLTGGGVSNAFNVPF